jgi:hypothetical protein
MYLRLHTGVPAGYSQDRPATAVLVRSAAHQPQSAKEKRSLCGSLLRPVCVSLRVLCVPNCGDSHRRHVSRGGGKGHQDAVAVGARPRFVQLASDDSYCGTFPVPANHRPTCRPFAFACPRSLDHAQSVNRRLVGDPPGTGLEPLCLCHRPRLWYRFRPFRLTTPNTINH